MVQISNILFNQLANYLKDIGVRKGDAVVIYLPMLMELPIAMLACARIGAVHSVIVSLVYILFYFKLNIVVPLRELNLHHHLFDLCFHLILDSFSSFLFSFALQCLYLS